MREYLPLLFVGAVVGVFSLIFLLAWWWDRHRKTVPDFDRHIPDGEIIRRLAKYALPYKKEFLLVLVIMLVFDLSGAGEHLLRRPARPLEIRLAGV